MTTVLVRNGHSEWKEVDKQLDIKKSCMEENWARFSEPTRAGILFTTKPLLDNFGYLVIGKNTWKSLADAHNALEGMDPYAQKFLKLLKVDEAKRTAELVSTVLMTDEYLQGWGKQEKLLPPNHLDTTLAMPKWCAKTGTWQTLSSP